MTLIIDRTNSPFGPGAFLQKQAPALSVALRQRYPAISPRQRAAVAQHMALICYLDQIRAQAEVSPLRNGVDRFLGGLFLCAWGTPSLGLSNPDLFGAAFISILGFGSLYSSRGVPSLFVRRAQARAWLADVSHGVAANGAMRFAFDKAAEALARKRDRVIEKRALRRIPLQKSQFSHLQNH